MNGRGCNNNYISINFRRLRKKAPIHFLLELLSAALHSPFSYFLPSLDTM